MRNDLVLDLADCTEFRQTLQARPPRVAHGTVLLLAALLGTALLWAALTRADLVVRAPGRVRPVSTPTKLFSAGRGEVLSASTGCRVIEVNFREGDEVRQGDVLIRLDTSRLAIEIEKRTRTIRAGEEELAKMVGLERLSVRQFEAARAKAEAELAQATEDVKQARSGRPPMSGWPRLNWTARRTRSHDCGGWRRPGRRRKPTSSRRRPGCARPRRSWARPACRSMTAGWRCCGGPRRWRSGTTQ